MTPSCLVLWIFTTNTVTGASAGDSTWKISVWNVFLSPDGFKKCIRKKWTGVQKPWHEVLDSATPCDKRTSLHRIKELRYFGRVQFGVKVLELGVTDISHHFTKLLSVMKVTRCKLSAGGGVEASGHTDLSTTETGTQIVSLCYCWEYCVLLCFLDSFKKKNVLQFKPISSNQTQIQAKCVFPNVHSELFLVSGKERLYCQ